MKIDLEFMRKQILDIICPEDEIIYSEQDYSQLLAMLVALPVYIVMSDLLNMKGEKEGIK